ncbi:MAG: CehA/McbA family metallohydrolase [Gemmatimonadota bacterium]
MRARTIRVVVQPLTLAIALATTAGAAVFAEAAAQDARRIAPLLDREPPPTFAGYPGVRHGGNYMHNYYLPPAPSSTPWAPAWSPDGRSIAVAMSGSIWNVDVDTGLAVELTHGSTYHSSPAWSPDGRWIVYTADHSGARIQLEMLDVETGETHRLTDDDFVYADPVFSPDGTRIAYVSSEPNGFFNVYVRPVAKGRWAGAQIAVTADNSYGSNRLYFGPQDMHLSPAWMPDGDELLIVSNRDVPLGSGNVIRVPARVGGISEATTVLREQTLYRTRPHVSLDGRRFVYSSTVGAADQFNNLYIQPTVGGEPYKLTFFQHDAFHPRWSPDGEWIAFITNEDGLPQLELLETYGGERRRIEISGRRWKNPMGTLQINVRVAGEGAAPRAARVTLYAADGKYYAPPDEYARIGQRGSSPLFHTDGTASLMLPPGETDVTTMKGFEIEPQRWIVEIRAGETTTLDVELDRMVDLSASGWHNGSTHVHMNYAGNLHNTLENLMFMSDAEDQDIVNEQVANKDNRILDHQFFVPGGGAHPISTPDRVMVVGQEYRPPFYGHVFMLGLRDHLISPFTTGYEGTAIESLYPSNTDMLRKARAQGAATGYVHAYFGNADPLGFGLMGGKGFMVDAVLGTTDALEWSAANRASFFPLYALWSNGVKVCATGGEDSISSLHRTPLLGAMRTYVKTADGALTAEGWYDGLRNSTAFVTNGPLVFLTVDGKIPGETLELAAGTRVAIRAAVRSITPLTRVWLVQDGEDVLELELDDDRRGVEFEGELEVSGSGWIHLRAEGEPEERFPLDAGYAQAFTNPVFMEVAGEPIRDAAGADYGLRWIDELQRQAEEWPGWRTDAEKAHVYAQFDEARAVYRRLRAEASEN